MAANFYGWIDEIRISKIVRSDDWILTEYNMMASPSAFATFGSEIVLESVYDSPMDLLDVADQWQWANFTWQNSDIPEGAIVGWRINYVDMYKNEVATGIMSFTIGGENHPPEIPAKPSGKRWGVPNREFVYTTSTTDIDGDGLSYNFSWGDGTYSGWIGGSYESGEEVNASHGWGSKSVYQVKVKAKDSNGAESDWSEPLSVLIFNFHVFDPVPASIVPIP